MKDNLEKMKKSNKQKTKNQVSVSNLSNGRKVPTNIKEIGNFSNKGRANERAKTLIKKQIKELGLLLLKINNTPADDVMNQENGFVTVLKVGGKTFYASEGVVGRKMIDNSKYFHDIVSKAERIEPDLKNAVLNATLKAQYLKKHSIGSLGHGGN
jgi:hypothetical protein